MIMYFIELLNLKFIKSLLLLFPSAKCEMATALLHPSSPGYDWLICEAKHLEIFRVLLGSCLLRESTLSSTQIYV